MGLAKVAIFTANVDAENQSLINYKCVYEALNRQFCQTAVTCWRSVFRVKLPCLFMDCNERSKCLSVGGGAVAKKNKTPKGGRKKIKFFLGGRKNTLSKKLLVALACSVF